MGSPISCCRRSALPAARALRATGFSVVIVWPKSTSSCHLSARGSASPALRCGRALSVGGGDRLTASLRPGAGRGALFGDHARSDPELQISRPAGGAFPVRPLAQALRRRASQRCRPHRACARFIVRLWWRRFNQSAMLAQGLSRQTGGAYRLLRAEARAPDGKPSGTLARAAQAQTWRPPSWSRPRAPQR